MLTGIDFSYGRWLLNRIDAPADVQPEIESIAFNTFYTKMRKRFDYGPNLKDILIHDKIPLNPSKSLLMSLAKNTGYDYFINLKVTDLNKKPDDRQLFSKNHVDAGGKYMNEVCMEVYDLKNASVIFSQRLVASSNHGGYHQSDLGFSRPSDKLALRAFRKLMKRVESNPRK